MERLNEIHNMDDEEPPSPTGEGLGVRLPTNKSILINNLSFTYPGAGNDPVLRNINLEIPQGKVTAIVGVSGSGKTTLLKLLLKVYPQCDGEIRIGSSGHGVRLTSGTRFETISPSYWRSQCGAVMQDGFIFND